MHARRAPWYVFSGILFVLAGLFAFYRIAIPSIGSLLLVIAGILVILLGFMKYHPTPDALAVFIISLLVFGLFASGGYAYNTRSHSYSFAKTGNFSGVQKLALSVSHSIGSIDISFSGNPNAIVNLTYDAGSGFSLFPIFPFPSGAPSVLNSTSADKTLLTVSASGGISSLHVVIGGVSVTSLNATTSTGSIDFFAANAPNIGSASLVASTGSVSATFKTSTMTSFRAESSTGSVTVDARYTGLPSNGTMIVKGSTGSVSLVLNLASNVGCQLGASNSLGSFSSSLGGFQVLSQGTHQLDARSLNYASAAHSIQASISTSTGSVSITTSVA